MQIENDTVRVLADYDQGISAIESKKATLAKIVAPRFGLRFTHNKKAVDLSYQRPDAVIEEPSTVGVQFSYRPEGLANKAVEVTALVVVRDAVEGALVQLRITNTLDEPIQLDHAVVLDVAAEHQGDLILGNGVLEWSFYRHGFQSFSASGYMRIRERGWKPAFGFLRQMEENPTNPHPTSPGHFQSEQVTQVINSSSKQALMVGFLESKRTFGDIEMKVNTRQMKFEQLVVRDRFDGIELAPGETITTEPLLVLFGSRGKDKLAVWADRVGSAMKARKPESAPTGWCSWYYYYTGIDEEAVLKNLNRLSDLKEKLPVSFFQVDDGYQAKIGDWLSTNKKFPEGMDAIANRIADAGFLPGIWTAPFYARPTSKVFREHRDWFVKTKSGRPQKAGWNPLWYGKVYALDPTHPEVQDHLRNVYTTLHKWGYRYFKIDFLYAAALPGVYHDRKATRASVLRTGLEIIRESVGEDSFILGCGCPIQVAVGIVDAMRIGMDVTPRWGNWPMRKLLNDRNALSTYHSILNTINRSFMHNRLFANDPDCLMVRVDRNQLNLDEVKTLATVTALSGGVVMISDNMETLPEPRIDLIETVLNHRTQGMEPIEPYRGFEPEVLVAHNQRGLLLGLLNFSDRPVTKIFDLKELMSLEEMAAIRDIREVWQGKNLNHQDGLLRFPNIPAHGARMIEVIVGRRNG